MNPTQAQPTAIPKHTHTKPPFKVWRRRKPSVSDCGEVEIGIQTDYPEALCNGSRSIAILTGGGFTREDSPKRAEVLADNTQLAAFIVKACNSHPALVAENKRLREALTDCIDRLDHHDDQSVPEVVNARAALSGVPESEWPYITPGMEARAALAKEDV